MPHHADHRGVEQVKGEQLPRHQGQPRLIEKRQTEHIPLLDKINVKIVT